MQKDGEAKLQDGTNIFMDKHHHTSTNNNISINFNIVNEEKGKNYTIGINSNASDIRITRGGNLIKTYTNMRDKEKIHYTDYYSSGGYEWERTNPGNSDQVAERQQKNDEMFDDILDTFDQFYRENNIIVSENENVEKSLNE